MNIVLYTPVYYTSPGTQSRVNLIRESLEMTGYKTTIVTGRESQLQNVYHTLGKKLLTKEITWKIIGKMIFKSIYRQKPKNVILFLDVSASAIPYLKKHDINTILSIEDLTPEYKNYDQKASEKFYQILAKYAEQADAIISSGYTLSEQLKRIGLRTIPVPVGLKPYVSLKEALARSPPPIILHAGQLNIQRQLDVILSLARRYKLMVHNFGKLASNLNHPNIIKYRELTPEKAMRIIKHAHIGLVIEYKKTYSLNRLYFHTSMLQPIIAEGEGPWIKEAHHLEIRLHPLEAIEKIAENYEQHVKECAQTQKKLSIPHIHKPLLNLLQ